MTTLASGYGGPGPWILLFPLIWAAAVALVVTVLRRSRTVWRGRTGPAPRALGDAPLAVLGRRFASGDIDEEEYWRRLSVLEEHFGRKGGDAA